jgi:hypothetical protein
MRPGQQAFAPQSPNYMHANTMSSTSSAPLLMSDHGFLMVCLCPEHSRPMLRCPNGHEAVTLASLVLAGAHYCLLHTDSRDPSDPNAAVMPVPLRPDFFSDEVLLEAWLKKALGEDAK